LSPIGAVPSREAGSYPRRATGSPPVTNIPENQETGRALLHRQRREPLQEGLHRKARRTDVAAPTRGRALPSAGNRCQRLLRLAEPTATRSLPWPGNKGEARRAAPDLPQGRAHLQRQFPEPLRDMLNHKACRTDVAAPTRGRALPSAGNRDQRLLRPAADCHPEPSLGPESRAKLAGPHPTAPCGRALLDRHRLEFLQEGLNHKACRTDVAAPTRRSGAALCW
jgi:hypothetical protein